MWSSLISAGGNMLGSVAGSAFSSIGAIYAAKKSDKQARQARHWMKMMSDTAHQREVKDLRAAGLNPILSAGGNGASSAASVPMPNTVNPLSSFEDFGSSVDKAINTSVAVKMARAEQDKLSQEKRVGEATERKLNAEAEQVNLENESLRLENAIKQGVYDPDNPMYVEKNIARGADGILNIIASSVPSMPYSSHYIKGQLARYIAYTLDNAGKSTSNQILARNLASLPSAADARFNETWLPRINSGLDIVDSLLDIFNFAKGMKNSSAKGKGGKKK